MRKIILVLAVLAVVAIVPGALFADWGAGGAAFYKSPVLIGQPLVPLVNVDQISFGGDVRLKLGWFQAEALLLYSAGQVNSLNMYLDAGVALDITILRLSLGVGPNLANGLNSGSPVQAGLNAKVGADLVFGAFSVGASYIMSLNLANGVNVATSSGLLGIQVLIWM
jgi:hypothetical protein